MELTSKELLELMNSNINPVDTAIKEQQDKNSEMLANAVKKSRDEVWDFSGKRPLIRGIEWIDEKDIDNSGVLPVADTSRSTGKKHAQAVWNNKLVKAVAKTLQDCVDSLNKLVKENEKWID